MMRWGALRTTALLVALFAMAPTTCGWSYVTVRGDSMEPTVRSGDLMVLQARPEYRPDEVVAYRAPALGDVVVLHRITRRLVGGSEPGAEAHGVRYVLRGDNNGFDDAYRPTTSEIIGRAVIHVSGGAAALAMLLSPGVRTLVVLGLAVLMAVAVRSERLRRHRRRARRSPMARVSVPMVGEPMVGEPMESGR